MNLSANYTAISKEKPGNNSSYLGGEDDQDNQVIVCQWDTTMVSLICCYFLILLVGTLGNALVIVTFKKKARRSVLNLLIMYLAAFDLAASVFVPFIFGYWVWTCDLQWHFGVFGCKTLPVATRVFTSVSVGVLLIMAIERCRAIVNPFKRPLSRRTIHGLVAGTVVLSVASETHYIMTLNVEEHGQCAVPGEKYYIYASIGVTLFRTVAFVSIFLSTTVLVTCRLQQKSGVLDDVDDQKTDGEEVDEGDTPLKASTRSRKSKKYLAAKTSNQSMLRTRRRKKAVKMLLVMMIVFGMTVLPRDLFQMSIVLSYLLPEPYWIQYS